VQAPRDKLGKALFGAACQPMPVKQAVPFKAVQWVKNKFVHNFCGQLCGTVQGKPGESLTGVACNAMLKNKAAGISHKTRPNTALALTRKKAKNHSKSPIQADLLKNNNKPGQLIHRHLISDQPIHKFCG
jgi:hypothetical protein